MSEKPMPDATVREKRIVAVRTVDVAGHLHNDAFKLDDGSVVDAATVVRETHAHEAHYTMIPPEGAPAYEAWQKSGLPLLVQVQPCPDCGAAVPYA